MINEYNKGGAFTEYIDKAVRCNDSTPEIECQKAIAKEYLKSLKEGVNRDEEGTRNTDQRTYAKCDC